MPSQRRNAAFSLNCDHAGAWRSERSFPAHRTLPPLQTMWEILIPCGSSSSHGGGASSDWPHRRAISALPLQGLGVVVLLLSDMQYYNPPPTHGYCGLSDDRGVATVRERRPYERTKSASKPAAAPHAAACSVLCWTPEHFLFNVLIYFVLKIAMAH